MEKEKKEKSETMYVLEENINEFLISWEWHKLPNSDSKSKVIHCKTDHYD